MSVPRVLKPTDETIAEAARLLAHGDLVAFPTETVYGLGADARDDRAVAGVFAAKGRPRFNPLIIHWHDAEAAASAVHFDARAERLAHAFWPGPLTIVLPRRAESGISLLCSVGLDTLAVRVPGHPIAVRLLAAFDGPVAAPSANRSGAVSPTTADHVVESLGGHVAMVLDGGRCPIGLESTVVDLSGPAPALLRHGGVPQEAIEELLGPLAAGAASADGREATDAHAPILRSPGQLASHYAPRLPLRLGVTGGARPGEALLAFGPSVPAGFAQTLNLSATGDLAEAAANLFAMMRALDRPAHEGIAAMPVPERGLGRAINDRLRRAAAPRA